MTTLKDIHFWPPTGREDQPWTNDDEDPRCDAFLRTARRVCERYSEAIRGLELPQRCSSIRFFVDVEDRSDVLVEIGVDPSDDFGRATIPTAALEFDSARRAALILAIIDGGLKRLATSRGWDPNRLDEARRAVVDHDFGFAWDGPWKSSRDRRLRGRLRFVLEDDGFGTAYVELEDLTQGVTLRSVGVRSFSTVEGFWRSAKTFRWVAPTAVEAEPFVGLFHQSNGARTWHLHEMEVVDSATGWPPPSAVDVSAVSGLAITVVGNGRTAADQPHRIYGGWFSFVNGVPEIYLQTFELLLGQIDEQPDWVEWWARSPVPLLEINGVSHSAREGLAVRVYDGHVNATLRRPLATILDGPAGAAQARGDVLRLLERVGTRLDLGPLPPLVG